MRILTMAILILLIVVGPALAPAVLASPTHGFLGTRGTSIIDSSGRVVILRGVNYLGYQSASDPKPHSELAYETFARLGFNVVRLPISWATLEPAPGMFYSSYLTNYVDRDIRWAKKYGIYIVLDMHQYNWAARFGGGGVPDWTVQTYPPTESGMRQAVSAFWNSTTLQDHLINVWTKIAKRYVNEPTVAGYDILNEPWVYSSVNEDLNASHVNLFYANVISAIRKVDTNHLIFLEPANFQAPEFPLRQNIVWSPHFYALSFARTYYPQNITLLEADFIAKYKKFVLDIGGPMWIGEFGAFMKDGGSSQRWLQDAIKTFDKYQIGWAWWAYSGSTSLLSTLYSSSQ